MSSSSRDVDDHVAECEASLVILSDTLEAEEIEALAGLSPDRTTRRGEVAGASGRARHRFSMWEITSGQGRRTPEAQVVEVLDRVRDASARIRGAAQDPRIHSVSFWVLSQDPEFAFDLPADRVMEIARLGASLKIKVYDVRDG